MVNDNTYWTADMEFNPRYVTYPSTAMLPLVAGDKVHTHCEWTNSTAGSLTFPNEMCVGAAFNMSPGAATNCVDGQWPSP
jgi:hypothetical protein